MSLIDLQPLLKRTAGGGTQIWLIRVEPEDNNTATIVTTHGLVDGAKQEARLHIKTGKNTGKKNETSPVQQAINEARAKWVRQQERMHYGLTVEESERKIAAAPMLAHTYEEHAHKVNWQDPANIWMQPKFDGHRCPITADDAMSITMVSRKGVLIESCPHIADQLYGVLDPGVSLDGELYIHGKTLNQIGSLITKKRAASADLCYMLYDKNDHRHPFIVRFEQLAEQVAGLNIPHIQLSRTQQVRSIEEAHEFQAACLDNGYEGGMLRHGTAGYRPGKRSDSLLKMKTFYDAEFTVVGYKEGKGTYEGMAVFECVTPAGNKFDVTAPGTHKEKRAAWQAKEKYLGKQLIVKYQAFTNTDAPVPFLPVAKDFVE